MAQPKNKRKEDVTGRATALGFGLLALASLAAGAATYRWLDKRVAYYFEFLPVPVKKQVDLVSRLSAPEFVLSVGGVLLLRGAYLHHREDKSVAGLWPYAYVPVSLFLAWLLKRNLKYLITRKRPLPLFVNHAYGFRLTASDDKQDQSFPSGHSALIFALAHGLNRVKLVSPAPAYTVAALLSLSRAPLNKHYLSDLIAGAYLGLAVPEAVLALLAKAGVAAPEAEAGQG